MYPDSIGLFECDNSKRSGNWKVSLMVGSIGQVRPDECLGSPSNTSEVQTDRWTLLGESRKVKKSFRQSGLLAEKFKI